MDRVEAAFKRFDTDGDGFIDWEEFKQVWFGSHSYLLATKCSVRWPRIWIQSKLEGYLRLVTR
jgi:hypothetical protein